jgi:hypothetical protein
MSVPQSKPSSDLRAGFASTWSKVCLSLIALIFLSACSQRPAKTEKTGAGPKQSASDEVASLRQQVSLLRSDVDALKVDLKALREASAQAGGPGTGAASATPQATDARPQNKGRAVTRLVITDKSGVVTSVRDFAIDYTSNSFVGPTEFVRTGIRIYQGESKVTVPWENIAKVVLTGEGHKPLYHFTGTLALADGTEKSVKLETSAGNGIQGKSDLGSFSIRLELVKSIVPE